MQLHTSQESMHQINQIQVQVEGRSNQENLTCHHALLLIKSEIGITVVIREESGI